MKRAGFFSPLTAFVLGFLLFPACAAAQSGGSLSIDVQTYHDNSSPSTTNSTPSFSTTTSNELLLAFIGSDRVTSPNTTVNSISGGGLTWQVVQRTNNQRGTSEIWRAFATAPLSNVSVTATLSQSVDSSLTIITFIGADATGSNGSGAIGAVGTDSEATGAPNVSLITTRNNSWVFSVGNDYDNAISRTPGPNQSLVHQFLAPVNDTYWVQQELAPTAQTGTTVVVNDTSPSGDRSNMSAVEVLPALSTSSTGLGIDVQVSQDTNNPSTTSATPSFSTANANELLLAFIAADSTNSPNTTVTGVSGGGLTWQLAQRTNTQSGTAEIWRAFSATALSNVAVTATLSQKVNSSMTVISFTGADSSGTNGSGAIGASTSGNGANGAPAASLTTTRNGSWVFGIGDDWDNAIPRSAGNSQIIRHEYLAPVNDTYWVQAQIAPAAQSGTSVTVNDTAPTTDRFNVSLVEVLPAPVSSPPSVTAVSPSIAVVGIAVTITGANFGVNQGSSSITFGGTLATVNSWSNTSIVAYVPNTLGVGSAPVVVNVPATGASNAEPFNVIAPPIITGISPGAAPIGSSISISGSNFALNGATPQVVLAQQGGGTIIAPIASASNTSISFTIPAGAATGDISVTSSGLTGTSSSALTIVASSTFSITAGPSSLTLIPGQTTTVEVSIASTNGFTHSAALSVTGLPSGVGASFQPQQITAGQFSILTLSAPSTQTASSSQLAISASATVEGVAETQSANVGLNVQVPGGSSFIGRVAVTDAYDTPLVGLTVRFIGQNYTGAQTGCAASTATDAAGNFALTGLSEECSGAQMVQYDPSTVTSPTGKYSGVTLSYVLTPGQVNTPGIIVHLPRVDNAETVMVAQNSAADQTFIFKSVPDVAITVYAGTTLSLADGSHPDPFPLSVVEIPYDKLPDYMPPSSSQDPVFAMSIEPDNSSASQPVAVSYPNRSNLPPGSTMPLTSLNPTLGMMVNYGTATVSGDGTQIVPDPDPARPGHQYGIEHFDWHFPLPNTPNSANPTPDGPKIGDPVDPASGLLVVTKTDLAFGGARGQVGITRTYRTLSGNPGPFGIGTNHNYGYMLDTRSVSTGLINLIMPDGNQFPFAQQPDGTFVNSTIPSVQGATISGLSCITTGFGSGCGGTLKWKDGTKYLFEPLLVGQPWTAFLMSLTDTNGNTTTLVHNQSIPMEILQIVDPVGRSLSFVYDSNYRITSITDPIGRNVQYSYNSQGTLATVTDAAGGITSYSYDTQNRLTAITDPRNIIYLQNTYDQNGRVIKQVAADGGVTAFSYTQLNPNAVGTITTSAAYAAGGATVAGAGAIPGVNTSPISLATVTDPLGNQTTYHFNGQGFLVDSTDALGRKTVYNRAAGTNLLTSVTDPLGRVTTYTYDSAGDTTSITRLSGTDDATTTSLTYDATFNKIASITDSLGNKTIFSYDKAGNLASITDPLNNQQNFTYDEFGEILSSADALNDTTQFSYANGFLTRATDPLGRTLNLTRDAVGRPISVTNASGQITQYQYNSLNQIVQSIDQRGSATLYSYDPNGNLLTITDPNQQSTTYAYDAMDRNSSRTNSLGYAQQFHYDLNGNLITFIDGRGVATAISYDPLNRPVLANYGNGESSLGYVYDAAGRLILASDSAGGTLSLGYDGFDRFTSETSSRGSIQYAYDSSGRRTTAQVTGQPRINYAYDNRGLLTEISQGSAIVSLAYDNAGRRTSLTLPNGISENNTYDSGSQLTAINYQLGTSALGAAAYAYDMSGRRVDNRGTFSGTNLPPVLSATYNSANQVTQFGNKSLTYDANGNLLSDGANNYSWNARNQLVAIQGAVSATFKYDAFGRRVEKTVNTSTTDYLYDGSNIVQEISSGTPTANLITGGVDEYFQRTDATGEMSLLTDALGSTVALANSQGTVQTQYTYDPFGNVTQSGTASGNVFGYAGREMDGTGLYYYRLRYYSPTLQRFISPDPQGFTGGLNLYGYVSNDPESFVDPWGESPCSKNDLINAQNAAMSNPAFEARNGQTFCNAATLNIIQAMGAPDAGLASSGVAVDANTMASVLANPNGQYRPVSPEQAQAIANAGGLAIAAYQNPNGHGHVATVRPQGVPGDNPPQGSGPLLNNIGPAPYTGVVPQSDAFSKDKKVTYYTPLAGRKDCP